MIGFVTQYVYGLGHSNRTKLIAEETAKYSDVFIIESMFRPPLEYKVPMIAFMDGIEVPDSKSFSGFIMSEQMVHLRIKKFKEILNKYDFKLIVIEGFPFCRHQYAHEYFTFLEECKKRDIKIIVSARDFPWDDPHEDQLKDWVNYTQNLVCKYYVDKILIHGDPNILPLYSDRTRVANSKAIIEEIEEKITYTGYVCDKSIKTHSRKNNHIYVTTGLNKNEGLLLFKEITKIANKFPDYKFVMPIANKHRNLSGTVRDNMIFVNYIPELGKKLQNCSALISYGGYNTTMEVLKGRVPSILVPRQDGQKLEQFVRCYTFEPFEFFKVLNTQEFSKLESTLRDVLNFKPKKFKFDMMGVEKSVNEIIRTYKS